MGGLDLGRVGTVGWAWRLLRFFQGFSISVTGWGEVKEDTWSVIRGVFLPLLCLCHCHHFCSYFQVLHSIVHSVLNLLLSQYDTRKSPIESAAGSLARAGIHSVLPSSSPTGSYPPFHCPPHLHVLTSILAIDLLTYNVVTNGVSLVPLKNRRPPPRPPPRDLYSQPYTRTT